MKAFQQMRHCLKCTHSLRTHDPKEFTTPTSHSHILQHKSNTYILGVDVHTFCLAPKQWAKQREIDASKSTIAMHRVA